VAAGQAGRVEQSTYDRYHWAVERHIVPLVGSVRLRDLTPEVVDEWIRSMAMEDAVQRGRLPRNPVSLTRPPRAVRPSTVKGRPVMKQVKTESSDRLVTVGPRTIELLREHRTRQAAELVFVGLDPREVELVFTSEVGGWIDPNNLGRTMESLAARAGVPRLTPRGLRHTAQSIGRVVVGDDKVMQERLGHADIGVTMNTYSHTVAEQHRRAGELIDSVFDD